MASATTQGEARASVTGVVAAAPSSVSASYSAAGETESLASPAGETRLAYRGDGSLSTVTTEDGVTSEYVTDVDGSRLLRVDRDGDAVRTTLYLPGQQVQVAVSGGVRSITTNRFYSLASGVQVAARKNNTNPVFTLADPHGTVSMTYQPFTSPTSPSVVRRGFDPYGNALSTIDPDGAGGSGASGTPAAPGWVDDRGFLNKPVNPESGLVDLQARQYDPFSGRFLSVDPLLDPASPLQANGYNYANNNPLTYSDPTGTAPTCVREGTCLHTPGPSGPAPFLNLPDPNSPDAIPTPAFKGDEAFKAFESGRRKETGPREARRGAFDQWMQTFVPGTPNYEETKRAYCVEFGQMCKGIDDIIKDNIVGCFGKRQMSDCGQILFGAASVAPWGKVFGLAKAAWLKWGTRSRGAANAAPKALPSGPKIAAQWGADTYRHGGFMTTIEHINYRHAFNSGFSGVSRYAQGTSAREIRGYVDHVLRNGTVTGRGMVGNVGRTIGTDVAGNPVSGLEIIVRDGVIKTAFPVAVP